MTTGDVPKIWHNFNGNMHLAPSYLKFSKSELILFTLKSKIVRHLVLLLIHFTIRLRGSYRGHVFKLSASILNVTGSVIFCGVKWIARLLKLVPTLTCRGPAVGLPHRFPACNIYQVIFPSRPTLFSGVFIQSRTFLPQRPLFRYVPHPLSFQLANSRGLNLASY